MTKAIILAAGQGTRLRPLTDYKPKCLVELAGHNLLSRQIEVIKKSKINDITVVAGYKSDLIINQDISRVIINENYATTNMVHTLFCARKIMDSKEDIIISYGDIIYEPKTLASVIKSQAMIGVTIDKNWREYWKLRMDNPLNDAETLKLNPNGNIVELGKKPQNYDEIQGQYMGLFKVRADHVHSFVESYDKLDHDAFYDDKDFDNMYMTSFLQHLIDTGWQIQSVPVNNGWLEIDTVEDLTLYEKMYQSGELDSYCKL